MHVNIYVDHIRIYAYIWIDVHVHIFMYESIYAYTTVCLYRCLHALINTSAFGNIKRFSFYV